LFRVLFSYYRTTEKRTKWPLIYFSQNNWLVFVVFLIRSAVTFRCATNKLLDFLFPDWFLHEFFCFCFSLFSQMLAVIVQEWNSVVFGFVFKLVETRSVETSLLWRLVYANVSLTHSIKWMLFVIVLVNVKPLL